MLKSVWSFVTTNWKFLGMIVIALVLIFSIKGCTYALRELKDTKAVANFNDSLSNSKISYYKDLAGKEHATAENVAITSQAALRQLADSISHLTKGKIKGSDITAVNKTINKTQVDIKPTIDTIGTVKIPCKGDSIVVANKFALKYHNPYIDVSGTVGTGDDSLHITAYDTLSRVDYQRKSWFLGPIHYYTDFSNTNPYVSTIGYKGVAFTSSTKYKWSVGPMLGIGYGFNSLNLGKPVIIAGISVQYSLIRF